MDEIANLKEQLINKTPVLEETLTIHMKQAQREAKLIKNQLAHVKAEVRDLCRSQEELQAALCRLANEEAEITRLQELLLKEKSTKRVMS